MKKIISIILASMLCIVTLASCGEPKEEKTYDEEFLKDFSKGLMLRWDMEQKPDETEEVYHNRLVYAEINKISDYPSKKFADTVLQEKAISYINLLKKQEEALKYFTSDYNKYTELWGEAYGERMLAIQNFIGEYNLSFPDKYKSTLNEVMTKAKMVEYNKELETKIEEIIKNINFGKVKTVGDYSYYEAIVENITDKEFEYFNLEINLLDSEGIILNTQYSNLANFKSTQKAKFEFMTDKQFEKYEVTVNYLVKE